MATLYERLGVEADASLRQVQASWRKVARQCHPDMRPQGKDAKARLREAQEAYETLSDTKKRAAYDASLAREDSHSLVEEIFKEALDGVARMSAVLVLSVEEARLGGPRWVEVGDDSKVHCFVPAGVEDGSRLCSGLCPVVEIEVQVRGALAASEIG